MKNDNTEVPLEEQETSLSENEHSENHESRGKENKKDKRKSVFVQYWKWPLLVLLMATTLSFSFCILSEMTMSSANIIIAIAVIVAFILIAIVADIIGVAVTVAKIGPFRAMASRKVRGSKEAIKLIQNAEKVASVAADIIGDICAILSGSAGAALATAFIGQNDGNFIAVVIASAVSAVIAGLTIFGKAMGKKYAIKKSENIILIIGKIASIFHRGNKKQKETKKHENKNDNIG